MRSEDPGVSAPFPPPLLALLGIGVGVGLGHLWPAPFGVSDRVRLTAAAFLLVAAFALGAWAMATLRRCKASPEFRREVKAIVQEGPYRFTRNPLYLALAALQLCFAGMLDNLWVLLTVPLLVASLDLLVIRREEAYLRGRFGEAYGEYMRRVRRWL